MIDYNLIANSCNWYTSLGYKYINVPWWTSLEINHITKPNEIKYIPDFHIPLNNKVLVASGEQSFLSMASKNQLPSGKLFTVTPCFRNEPETEFHCNYFIKNELIDTFDISDTKLDNMVDDAFNFFNKNISNSSELKIVETKEGFDIEYGGIELGSYGIRSCEFLDWIFGTGCAEPRLSRAIRAVEI